ncbi:MAG: class I SAM-dependent methyltransferase, partial [Microcoleaceae cyanobacterium]
VYKKIGGAEDSAYYRYLCQFFKIAYLNLVTVEYIRYPGNSLDRQMPKFELAPGAYQGILPHEKPELFAESRAIEQARLEILKGKYQEYLQELSPEQSQNIQSTVEPTWKIQYIEFCQNKKFQYTQDWFSHNIPIWSQVLQRFVNQPDLNFLEVGSWEGRSTCWLLDQILTHPSAKITCVDTFVGSVEHQNYESGYLQSLEDRFDFNIAQTGFSDQVEKQKGSSQIVLRSLPLNHYDFYYVDGSHLAPDVLEDIMLGWRLVKVNGIIIFDDYNLKLSEKPTENVKLAVDAFYAVFQEKIKLLYQGYQVIIEKIVA